MPAPPGQSQLASWSAAFCTFPCTSRDPMSTPSTARSFCLHPELLQEGLGHCAAFKPWPAQGHPRQGNMTGTLDYHKADGERRQRLLVSPNSSSFCQQSLSSAGRQAEQWSYCIKQKQDQSNLHCASSSHASENGLPSPPTAAARCSV